MTLHEAIAWALKEHGAPLHPEDIAAEVNRRKLYRRRDGLPVEKSQIYARRSNNSDKFTLENRLIGLVVWRTK